MRLLQLSASNELSLTSDLTHNIPPYAILSHTWGIDGDEVTFQDIKDKCFQHKPGYQKILFCGNQARSDGLEHFWVDTCCIDKSSSAELTEAINSMFRWYRDAQKCYAFLADVCCDGAVADEPARSTWKINFRKSRWFTRGWTLQELLAPTVVEFFSVEGQPLGGKTSLGQSIHEITHIPIRALQTPHLDEFNIETRMSWAKDRLTTKGEDKAYCLFGILGVSMPSNYGEGEEGAFKRLKGVLAADQDNQVAGTHLGTSIDQCLAELRISDPRDDKSRIVSSKGGLLKDSYRWIFENADFKQWHSDKNSSLLWIKGDPGKGKTMLLCGITDELAHLSTNQPLVSYFFCQATDRNLNNATAILRGLIYMLIRQKRSSVKHLYEEWKVAGSRLFEDANAWDALTRILISILQDCQRSEVVFVIDALDECSGNDLPKLIKFITQHSQTCEAKWLVSSRNWPEIEDMLDTASRKVRLSLELNRDSITAAVKVYIRHKAEELRSAKGLDDIKYNEIVVYMDSNANQTFLWVALVCQALQDPKVRPRHILAELKRFPPGLGSLYERMLSFIDASLDAELCLNVLGTVSITYRPIHLAELLSLVEPGYIENLIALQEVVESCGSFLIIRNDIVYFVHQSAKDFLITNAIDHIFPHSGIPAKHRALTETSLKVLSQSLKRDMYNLQDPCISVRNCQPTPDPLAPLRYSCVFWVDHLIDGGFYDTQQDWRNMVRATKEFLQQKYLYWLEALSLLGATASGISSVTKLLHCTEGYYEIKHLEDWLSDAVRFFKYNKFIITQYPLQAYAAALIFSPTNSLIRRGFRHEEPWMALKPRVETRWSAHLQTLEGHTGGVALVAFSHDSRLVASASDDQTVRIWDAETGEQRQVLEGHTGRVTSVAFSHDSRLVASASYDQTVRIWDAETGEQRQVLKSHTGGVISVAFSHDSRLVASASDDRTVRIWDAETGEQRQVLEGHMRRVASVAFSHDSRLVASASYDRTVRIWDAETGEQRQVLQTGYVDLLHWEPDGTQLLTSKGLFSIARREENMSGGVHNDVLHEHIMPDAPVLARQHDVYGISHDSRWIMFGMKNILWLPLEYRAGQSAISGDTVIIGSLAGRVLIMRFR